MNEGAFHAERDLLEIIVAVRTELGLVAALLPRHENIDHQVGRTKHPHLQGARVGTFRFGQIVMAQTKPAGRIGPRLQVGNLRRAIGIGFGVHGLRREVFGAFGKHPRHHARSSHDDTALARRHDDQAVALAFDPFGARLDRHFGSPRQQQHVFVRIVAPKDCALPRLRDSGDEVRRARDPVTRPVGIGGLRRFGVMPGMGRSAHGFAHLNILQRGRGSWKYRIVCCSRP